MAKWKKRIDGTPAQIGQPYKVRETTYPYGARAGGSGVHIEPQPRSVESFKKPNKTLTIIYMDKAGRKHIVHGVSSREQLDYWRKQREGKITIISATGKPSEQAIKKEMDEHPQLTHADAEMIAAQHMVKKAPREKEKRQFTIHGRKYLFSKDQIEKEFGCEPEDVDEIWKAGKRSSKGKKGAAAQSRREKMKIEETTEYKAGLDQAHRDAALGKYRAHKSKSEKWKKGYDAGWRNGFKSPKYDEIVLINTEEDVTAWEKRREIMESEAFQIWLNERYNTQPMPSNPYQAYMIDKSLKAKLKDKPEWAARTNVADWHPVDYPPVTKKPAPDITQPAPKTLRAQETKKKLRDHHKFLAKKMGVSEPGLRFTTSQTGRARSFYRSGYAISRATGQIHKVAEPEIVLGIPKSGELHTEQFSVLAHEMGHHKTVKDKEKVGGQDAVLTHYSEIQRSSAAKVENEREAWREADPYMSKERPVQKWIKKYALGSYLGTTPGYK